MSSPSLPSELIDHILSFYFDSHLPLATPTSVEPSSSPLLSSSHLLLVSKLFYSLTLPHLFRSITILTSHDYLVYWHPTRGIFAGKSGREKASFVQELKINGAQTTTIPIDLPVVRSNNKRIPKLARVLVELSSAPLPRLKHVCFFDFPNEAEVHQREKNAGRMLAGDLELKEDIGRLKMVSRMTRRTRGVIRVDIGEVAGRIEGLQRILDSLKIERHRLFHQLLSSSSPIETVRMQLNHSHVAILLFETLPTLPLYPPLSVYPCSPHPFGETSFFATADFVSQVFDSNTPCDFIGVPPPCRRAVVDEFRGGISSLGRVSRRLSSKPLLDIFLPFHRGFFRHNAFVFSSTPSSCSASDLYYLDCCFLNPVYFSTLLVFLTCILPLRSTVLALDAS
ncbi:hypothetical protein BDY24DRAFT_441428 [Mrakia frigida]|uniref:uncharacterized protein n=1 Tax=Mrakia frigida TaxID=29902 RepID=UPI003FCC09EB